MIKTTYKNLTATKYEHDTVVVSSDNPDITIVFDPFQAQGAFKVGKRADIIFISHDHFDHFSPKDIQSLAGRDTIFVFPSSILDKVQTFLDVAADKLVPVVPLEEYKLEVRGAIVTVMAVPAYNVDKKSPQGNLYHPKEREYVGFVLDVGGTSIYFVGDSDPIPEMDALIGMVEVLMLPISGVYVMNTEEAVGLTQKLQPVMVLPMHYGAVVGDSTMGEVFRQTLSEQAPNIVTVI